MSKIPPRQQLIGMHRQPQSTRHLHEHPALAVRSGGGLYGVGSEVSSSSGSLSSTVSRAAFPASLFCRAERTGGHGNDVGIQGLEKDQQIVNVVVLLCMGFKKRTNRVHQAAVSAPNFQVRMAKRNALLMPDINIARTNRPRGTN